VLAATVAAVLTCASAFAQSVTRGPFLQIATPYQVLVSWRTDVPTDSRVVWGPSTAALDQSASDGTSSTEHLLAIDGLTDESVVYYAVGTTSQLLAGGTSDFRFRSAPLAGGDRPVRIWALGDGGTGDSNAQGVRDGFDTWNAGREVDAWLMLGDNAYESGTENELQAKVFDAMAAPLERWALWPAFGNHDGVSSNSSTESGPYYDAFTLPRTGEAGGLASGTEAYYSFDLGDVHLVALDSAESSLAPAGAQLNWLVLDLAANLRPWTVVYFHHPPYTHGSHDSDNPSDSGGLMFAVRENVLPILEGAGVDLVLSGHSHDWERSYLLDGHYDTSDTFDPSMQLDAGDGDPAGDGAYLKQAGPHQGTVYVVAGSGAKLASSVASHPAMARSIRERGSLAIEIQGEQADGYFVRGDGTVGDHFRLIHVVALFSDSFESGDTGNWSAALGSAP